MGLSQSIAILSADCSRPWIWLCVQKNRPKLQCLDPIKSLHPLRTRHVLAADVNATPFDT